MSDPILPITDKGRFSGMRRAWLPAWIVGGLLLFAVSFDFRKPYYMMAPLWLALTPGRLPRFSPVGRGLLSGYTLMLCFIYFDVTDFNFDIERCRVYFDLLVFGSLGGFIIAISRCGLGPESPVGERVFQTALMTLALAYLFSCWAIGFYPTR